MIEFVRGTVHAIYPTHAVIDVGGLGYKVFISAGDYGKITPKDQETTLYTSFVIRDNAQSLYGFLTIKDRNLFEILLTVSGIGPKTALALISNLNIDAIQLAIHNNDVTRLSRVPGIGKKTAERLILEVRDKISSLHNICETFSIPIASEPINDAISALTNLGYNKKDAEKAIRKTIGLSDRELDLAELITSSLQHI